MKRSLRQRTKSKRNHTVNTYECYTAAAKPRHHSAPEDARFRQTDAAARLISSKTPARTPREKDTVDI